MTSKSELEKLQIILPHWLAHNREHAEEFEKWSALAQTAGQGPASALIATAAAHLRQAGEALAAALAQVGGAKEEAHAHEHGHHHHH